MRRLSFFIATCSALICGVQQVAAQSGVDSDDRRVVITNSDGEDVLKIFSNDNSGNTVISFATFDVALNNNGRYHTGRQNAERRVRFGKSNNLAFFEIGMNTFPHVNYSLYSEMSGDANYFMDLHNAKSLQFNFALWRMTVYLNESRTMSITTGLQLCFNDYVFSGNVTLAKENGMLVPLVISPQYKKSKMTTASFKIPVMFNIGKYRSFQFSAGVYGGVILGSHTKVKFPKEKMYNLYMRPFLGGVTARVGYHGFYVYADYGLSGMFKQGKGPGVMPLTIGLGLGF